MVRSWTIQSDLARGENRVDLYLLGDLSIRLASLTCVGRRCEQGCADGPVLSLPRSRLLAGEAEFRLPGTVCLVDLPVALRNTRRVKGSSATICPAIVRVATRMPSGPRSTPSIVAADRRAALPRETVARAGIGWSANPPPVTTMVPEPAARIAGAAACATTTAPITSTAYAACRWAAVESSSRSGAPMTAL